jgi:hypothetical protein
MEMGPERCTETSVTMYQYELRNIPEERIYKLMCLAVGHLNLNYAEVPKRLSQRRDAALLMVAK